MNKHPFFLLNPTLRRPINIYVKYSLLEGGLISCMYAILVLQTIKKK